MKLKKSTVHRFFFLLVMTLLPISIAFSEEASVPLDTAQIDPTDYASLQRGAELFMNKCSGCHSLKFMRYSIMAKDIGIVDASGQIMEQAVKDNLMFVGDKITDTIRTSMTKEEGAAWFGVAPPDLSLITRSRSVDWLYTYLRSFYLDEKRPWGVNNRVFPDVAMPDVLYSLKVQLLAEKQGQEQFDRAALDLVNFLSYVGEPMQETRKRLGIWVLLFLGIFFIFAWLLKREYWKDVHH